MLEATLDYIAAGGNRHPSAADWDPRSGLLAYGTDRNVALWSPLDEGHEGIQCLLRGHTDHVNAVKFFPTTANQPHIILSGSADSTIRIWRSLSPDPLLFLLTEPHGHHEGSVNCLAVCKGSNLIASGSTKATVKIWRLMVCAGAVSIQNFQTIAISPRLFPLALVLHQLDDSRDHLLAIAGTRSIVQIYVSAEDALFHHQATLSGHEDWVRSLAICHETPSSSSDLLLASASQDKYIRLWRVAKIQAKKEETLVVDLEQQLSNKIHKITTSNDSYSITFEALLLGHEDWVYTIAWRSDDSGPQLLSSSADNSIALWQPEQRSGVWVCIARLGEISALKGATTATGSTGGFWIGLMSPSGKQLASLGKTGSWRLWNFEQAQGRWLQGIGVSGHTKPVTDLAWAKDGSYLLTTGSDQTTRLHASWEHETQMTWHEIARPQIHGYDLNCIDSINQAQFVSGADEKLLRVFDAHQGTADLLERLCNVHISAEKALAKAADMPVLGLSNKAIEEQDCQQDRHDVSNEMQPEIMAMAKDGVSNLLDETGCPPSEDHLTRHSLWPEREKLYGHGYEISAVAASHNGALIATSCRASALEHAVIRLYITKAWREMKPPLTAHTLTVTALRFSEDDEYLLSVGRDRQWTVFQKDSQRLNYYQIKYLNAKGHSRMILDACWAPVNVGRVFATAGRDKNVKLWKLDAINCDCITTIAMTVSVTAISIAPQLSQADLVIASGTEIGHVNFHTFQPHDWTVRQSIGLSHSLCPSRSITQLAWRPPRSESTLVDRLNEPFQLAIASEDGSLRLATIPEFSQ